LKTEPIDFRALLERVLPLERLPLSDRATIQRALRSGLHQQIEEAGLFALRRLEAAGTLVQVPAPSNGSGPVLRFQSRDRLQVFTVHVPGPQRRDGWLIYPRSSLPPQAQTGIEQIRQLIRIDDPALFSDPRSVAARDSLAERLQEAGRELFESTEVRYVPARPEEIAAVHAFDPELVGEVLAHPTRLWYCPDASRAARAGTRFERADERSVVMAAVTDAAGTAIGHLEIFSGTREAFRLDDLALVTLLADFCGSLMERAARLEKLVFIDPLTSAYNRSYFDLQVRNEMARAQREESSMALCIADIDDFKRVNTTFGYQAGNEVLAQVAHALRRGTRPFDSVSRWGGEEFAVLLTAPVQATDVATVSERLRGLVERQVVAVEGLDRRVHRVAVTVSIGIALYPDHAETPDDLWRAANQALLEAKHPPKNQVVFFGGGRRAPRLAT
jgi:diguanylate cyclase (GGDEF)-like protein